MEADMKLTPWEPFRELDDLFHRYANLAGRSLLRSDNNWSPTANISETDKEYLIKAELPEVKKEDVKVTLENGVITISGDRKQEKEEKSENEIRVESMYGTFSRSFVLPDNIDPGNVSAESRDGVLRIRIPKTSAPKTKSIAINVK
ncbi:MAG: Hsp20/alpha crystallin family protein [Steroidobacteraceae bacterium]